MSEDQRIKVTVDQLGFPGEKLSRVFVAEGETVKYERSTFTVEHPPVNTSMRWPKKTVTTHTLKWETVTYD